MVGNSAKYPNRLKEIIKQTGLTIKEVADETKIPLRTLSEYCSGKVPIPRKRLEDIAHIIGCPTSDLVPDFPAARAQAANQENFHIKEQSAARTSINSPVKAISLPLTFISSSNAFPLSQGIIGQGSASEELYMDQLRRDLLHLLGTAGVTLPFSELAFGWRQMRKFVAKSSQLDVEIVHSLEMVNKYLWDLYKTVTPKSLALDGVLGQIKTLLHFLRETQAASSYRKLSALTSEMSQLAGEIFFDCQDHHSAATCYAFSATAAKDAEDYDLWACALVRYAFLPIYNAQYQSALPYVQEAQRLAQKGVGGFTTRYWVAAVEAEVLSGIGDLLGCQKALAKAQETPRKGGFSPPWLRFEAPRLPALQGACFTRLHHPRQAIPALAEALAQQTFQTSSRRRGLVLIDRAAAEFQLKEIEQSCKSLQEVLEMISCNPSNFLRREIYKKRLELEPFADTTPVKQLDEHIHSTF